MMQICYLRLYFGTETDFCHLLQRVPVRMEMDLSENRHQFCTYWLAVTAFVFSAQLKARNGLCKRLLSKLAFQYKDTLRAKNTEASIPVKG